MPLESFSPDENLALARTLPSSWYFDPEQLAREMERVFERTWQWVSRSSSLENPGDFVALELSGEPLLIARGEDDELRGFFNVCRHRAGPVAKESGNRKLFQCGYHGWTYGLDGRLRRAPEMEGAADFRKADICLPSVSVSEWKPLVFATLRERSEVPTPSEWLSAIDAAVNEGFDFERGRLRCVERREYLVEANWKTYVDNYLEGYHIPIVHPGLFRLVDYERYRVETSSDHSAQIAPLRSADTPSSEALYYWVFPNLMLNFYPGGLQVNGVFPLGAERTLTVFEWYGTDGNRRAQLDQEIAFSEQVQQEDMEICALVQRGLRSRSYDRGRFSVRRENGVHHFHRLLAERLADE